MELHPRTANALVLACKQRGDWGVDERGEETITRAPVATARTLVRLGLAEYSSPGTRVLRTCSIKAAKAAARKSGDAWITITPLGREVAERRFNRSNSASMPLAGL